MNKLRPLLRTASRFRLAVHGRTIRQGSPTLGIFPLGRGGGFAFIAGGVTFDTAATAIASSERYFYASDASALSVALTTARGNAMAAGNRTLGIVAGGNSPYNWQTVSTVINIQTSVEKITWASMAVAPGTVLPTNKTCGAAFGNSTRAIFHSGTNNPAGVVGTVYKYTYSTDANVLALTDGAQGGGEKCSAAGTEVVAVMIHNLAGTAPSATARYTYASDTQAVGTALTSGRVAGAAFTDGINVIFAAGGKIGGPAGGIDFPTTSDKYNIATDVVAPGPSMGGNFRSEVARGGASNKNVGLITGGFGNLALTEFLNLAATQKYIFASDTSGAGAVLSMPRGTHCATSSDPGGF